MTQKRGSPKVTEKQFAGFLVSLKAHGNVTQSVTDNGFGTSAAYDRRRSDEAFAKAWDAAVEEGHSNVADLLKTEAFRRGHDGVEEYQLSRGDVVKDPRLPGQFLKIRKYSDSLLTLLLQAYDKKTFKPPSDQRSDAPLPADLAPDPVTVGDEPGPDNPVL